MNDYSIISKQVLDSKDPNDRKSVLSKVVIESSNEVNYLSNLVEFEYDFNIENNDFVPKRINGINNYKFPKNGFVRHDDFLYDLMSFENFHKNFSRKFPAKLIDLDDHVFSIRDNNIITVNKIRVKSLFSEVGSWLSVTDNVVAYKPNIDGNKIGTNYYFNKGFVEDYFVPLARVNRHIHLHPSPNSNVQIIYSNILPPIDILPQLGPSFPNDYLTNYDSTLPLNVIIDDINIYLVGTTLQKYIIIRRKERE